MGTVWHISEGGAWGTTSVLKLSHFKPGSCSKLSEDHEKLFPQQLPGPAHPEWPGLDPQQPVSPDPGNPDEAFPEKEEVTDIFFSRFLLPHLLHSGISPDEVISISTSVPQSVHKKS